LTKPVRLDLELVRRGLVRSRAEATRAISAGKVAVRGIAATRAATLVGPDVPIALIAPASPFVSRGGEKLDYALTRLRVEIAGRRWLDVGASTGGFTDRLLKGGAERVAALDVGYGQLDWRLRTDDRVTVIERTNARFLTADALPWPPDGVTADVSFISLTLVVPAVAGVTAPAADFLLLVKPQFELDKADVPAGGVVRDPGLWTRAIERVVGAAQKIGLGLVDATVAEPPGPAGNREFFVHLRPDAHGDSEAVARAVRGVPS
jgi:23S rRNA (cytidine1920-2'-O)/16S rRNA (cytidine1409-2'-O)-methyltransferase